LEGSADRTASPKTVSRTQQCELLFSVCISTKSVYVISDALIFARISFSRFFILFVCLYLDETQTNVMCLSSCLFCFDLLFVLSRFLLICGCYNVLNKPVCSYVSFSLLSTLLFSKVKKDYFSSKVFYLFYLVSFFYIP
jgi:hypothetical protein